MTDNQSPPAPTLTESYRAIVQTMSQFTGGGYRWSSPHAWLGTKGQIESWRKAYVARMSNVKRLYKTSALSKWWDENKDQTPHKVTDWDDTGVGISKLTDEQLPSTALDVLGDGIGYISLLDVMGDDMRPVQAARVSYNAGLKGEEADTKLARYLLKNHHTTPFEMVELLWEVKLPIFVARQWVRHRTANINEFSMRYADPAKLNEDDKIEFYTPKEWRAQDTKNKQGSIEWREAAEGWDASTQLNYIYDQATSTYERMIKAGIAKELARIVLPVAAYTKWWWKNDLKNTLHFLSLRMDPHAQWEIRMYAETMYRMMKARLPILMGLWEETIDGV